VSKPAQQVEHEFHLQVHNTASRTNFLADYNPLSYIHSEAFPSTFFIRPPSSLPLLVLSIITSKIHCLSIAPRAPPCFRDNDRSTSPWTRSIMFATRSRCGSGHRSIRCSTTAVVMRMARYWPRCNVDFFDVVLWTVMLVVVLLGGGEETHCVGFWCVYSWSGVLIEVLSICAWLFIWFWDSKIDRSVDSRSKSRVKKTKMRVKAKRKTGILYTCSLPSLNTKMTSSTVLQPSLRP